MRIQPLIYFRAALLLPIALPLVLALIVHLLGSSRLARLSDFVGGLLMLPILSVTVAGGAYLLFAVFMAWFIGTLTLRGMIFQALLSPLYFAALVFVSSVLWGFVTSDPGGGVKVGALAVAYALTLGYAYVAVTLGVYFLISV